PSTPATPSLTIAASELLEMVVETEAGAGARGLSVVGGGKAGLFVKDVLKDSPAARVLSLQEGDQLLSARVYFDNIKYEDALQILKWAEPYKISFCLKRVVPSADVSRQPGATVFEVRGPKAKLAKLNIQGLSSLKRKKKKKKRRIVAQSLQGTEARPAAGKPEVAPVDVEFSFPTFSKLRKARSAGEVAVAETKRHRLKFPRLKVKDAVAAEARLATGLPHIGLALKDAGRGGGGGGEEKMFRFTLPFSRAKKPKEEAGEERERGFQAPQVALALPLPKVGAEEEEAASLELGWPKVEAALPKGSASALETPPGLLQAGLKLPAAEVAAPKVDIDLALPRLECAAAPEAAPKREGFRVKVPKFGVSAEEAELKLPLMKAPALEMALGEKSREQVLEDQLRPAGAMPSLELPFPKGKPGMESPEVSGGISLVSLPQLGGAGKLPQVEVSLGKPGSPKADKTKGSIIQLPGLEISLREHPLESQEAAGAAGASQMKLPEVRVPSLDISAPKVQDIHLCKPAGEPAASSGRAKPKEAAEGAGIKFQMPQISLPKFDFPVKPAPSPPPVQVKMPKPEGDPGVKVSLPKAGDVSLLAMKVPGVQLPKVPRPELGISVEKPEVEVTPSPAPLSFPAAPVPVLDIQLPKVGVELDLMKHERGASEQGPKAQGVTREALSKDLQVEISLPKGAVSQPGLEPGMRSIEGPALAGMVAKFPKVDLAFEKQPADAQGPKTDLEGAKTKLPTVEIPPIGLPEMTTENQAKGKTPRFALSKFSISGPKVWSKMSPEVSGVEGREAADLGSKLKLPKFGIYFPKSKGEAEAEGAKLASPELLGVEFKGLKLSLPSFGGQGREEAWGALESREVKWQDGREGWTGQPEPRRLEKDAKASRFRIASFGLVRRDVEAKGKAAPGSPKEKPKGPFGKMPQLKLSSLKAPGERRRGHLPAPEPGEKALPQVELPRLAPRAEAGLIPEPESPGFRVPVPSVEIAGPGSKAEAAAGRPAGDTAVAELQQREGGLQRPQAPSIQVSAPTLELGIGLPMAGREEGVLQAAPGTGAKIKLPKLQGERGEVLLQDGASKLGKIPLPQVELLSPSKGAETDPELSLKLVKADEVKEETHRSATIATALKAAKFKPPRVALSGFKKHNGELAPEAVSEPGLQVGAAPLKAATKGEPSSKFRFPKLALSSRPQEVLEISKHQQDQGGPNFRLPAVAFSPALLTTLTLSLRIAGWQKL
uniref:Periaxin n=1 Tax=Pseudonaja textilis TaxID=8673 RepID=A0A670ZR91_PSETE